MPILVGERVHIRPHKREELKKLVKLRNRGQNQWGWRRRFYSLEEVEAEFERNGLIDPERHVVLAIVDKNTQDYLGAVEYFNINWFDATVSLSMYLLGEDRLGKGIGSEATRLIVSHLMGDFPFVRIEAETTPDNQAARRVLEKNGFVLEGTKRMAAWAEGKWQDLLLYALTRPDWERLREGGE